MLTIAEWLTSLGLSDYAQRFAENDIDISVLPDLTDQHLKDLGVTLGHRLKLQRAIRELQLSPNTQIVAIPGSVAEELTERRQLTVMFCDLVGSTQLSQQLDPEDFTDLILSYRDTCSRAILDSGGSIGRFLGDGILAYFGYPRAHEDDAGRACRAGLRIITALAQQHEGSSLKVRIACATGLVLVGDIVGEDVAEARGIMGATPNLAARLQAMADPGTLLVSDETHALLGALFEQEDLGLHDLKGVAGPVRIWRVVAERQHETRFAARVQGRPLHLIGRRPELDLLVSRWSSAGTGRGQIVHVAGEPGIGKSRLVHALRESIAREAPATLIHQCSPYHQSTALYPFIESLERVTFQFGRDDSASQKVEKLEAWLGRNGFAANEAAPLFASLLSIPTGDRYPSQSSTPERRKQLTMDALIKVLLAHAVERPALVVFEDLHWADPTTLELLELLLDRTAAARLMAILTYRPDFRPPWTGRGSITEITLDRLDPKSSAEMVQRISGGRPIPAEVHDQIITKTDGVPLFIEELTKTVIESGLLHEIDGHFELAGALNPLAIPATLSDSLMARLDRLGTAHATKARIVAQTAAVIGREFSHDMLRSVASVSEGELDAAIEDLKQNEIIYLIDTSPSTRYAFKHALVRDVAYESLLKANRRQIHGKIAGTIESQHPELAAKRPEILAYHYSVAGNAETAIRYWMSGGRRARTRSANLEALDQYQKALELLGSLPQTPERRATELEIQLSLGGCFIALRGYSSEETRKVFESALRLSTELGDGHRELQAIFGLWGHFWMRAEHNRAIELGEMLLAKADQLHNLMALIVGWRSLGSTLFTFGDFVRAREHLDRAVALGQPSDAEESSLMYAVHPPIAAQLMLAWDLWVLGYPEQALTNVLRARSQAVQRDEAYTLAFSHYVTSAVQLLCGQFQDALASADQSLSLSREHGISLYALYSRFGRGCALAKLGQLEQAKLEVTQGLEEARRINLGYMRGFMLGWLATIQLESGDPQIALSTLEKALAETNDVTGRAWEAELLRLRGNVLLAARPDAVAEAEQDYNNAIRVAQKQNARSLELRAATSLTRLLRSQGKPDEGRAQLAPMLSWFTEGFTTADLKEAKDLLETLKS